MENVNNPRTSTPGNPAPGSPSAGIQDGKTIAVLAYITFIGWIVAFVMHGSNKTSLGAYHLRQTIGLILLSVCFYIVQAILVFIPFIGWIISLCFIPLGIGLFVLWIIGLINAINGQEKPIPLIGLKADKMFHGIN